MPVPTELQDPCNPSPCGSNALCTDQNHRSAACQCISEYFGDPYVACRPECLVNSDCPSNKACQNNKCIDPCPGTCGVNAICRVVSHVPTCMCIVGYVGDPFTECRLKPLRKYNFFFYPWFHSCSLDCAHYLVGNPDAGPYCNKFHFALILLV